MKNMGIVFCCVLGLALLVGLGWALQTTDLEMRKHFDPKYEDVRRNTFEQSKAYNQGMIQELQNMQFEYVKAEPAHKDALASVILHRSADYKMDKLPEDLRIFITALRDERTKQKSFGEPTTQPQR